MKYLSASSLQFGFKPNFGCDDAIHTVNRVVDHFTHNGSTVNKCPVDMTKAFDHVSHSLLFSKLMDRKVPKDIILLLLGRYDKTFNSVKWGSSYSNWGSSY